MTDLIAVQKIAGWEKLKTLVLRQRLNPLAQRESAPERTPVEHRVPVSADQRDDRI